MSEASDIFLHRFSNWHSPCKSPSCVHYGTATNWQLTRQNARSRSQTPGVGMAVLPEKALEGYPFLSQCLVVEGNLGAPRSVQ